MAFSPPPNFEAAFWFSMKLIRATYTMLAITTAMLASFAESSLVYRMSNDNHLLGDWALVAMWWFGVIALADCIINDWLPKPFAWVWVYRWRHMLAGLIAAAHGLLFLEIVFNHDLPSDLWSLPYYGQVIVICVIVAWFGAKFRNQLIVARLP